MISSIQSIQRVGFGLALACAAMAAPAQGLDSLKGMASGASGLGSLGSMSSGSMGNAAGVLEYCMKNNFLGGADASSVKDSLMSKIPGNQPQADPGYADGAKGLLTGSDGKKMDLTGGGLKKEATQRACDFVLKQGKSML